MTHRQGIVTMVLVTLLWSIAGVVTRQLDSAASFEVTFWRSAFNALALGVLLAALRGPRAVWATLRSGGRTLWLSGLCWSVMFTAFMVALTLTTVANVLVTMALGPLFTALLSRVVLQHRLAARTWIAIVLAGVGIAWMYGNELLRSDARALLGIGVALAVPLAAATNWTVLQYSRRRGAAQEGGGGDMLPAVLIGALLSSAATLPLAAPFQATGSDLAWLALLGALQLAVPCLLCVAVSRVLHAPEMSLLGLLEVLFGVLWAWLGADETPAPSVLAGGTLVLGALALDAALGLRQGGAPTPAPDAKLHSRA
ncbi:DMT family transporter [Azohydromonas caseinilytica]|uniref:DMT family transporter n=1 Tax=Azohydromonas caseinilytica TaxID=2728836 RepID=A0A848FDH3_9BURK|nr:DMT family transporter [Azohydromonas caseinilytica]NML17428.1 DMT family transporter [Azohydromonas caseinilytica]